MKKPASRQVPILRIMFWVACVAALLASGRITGRPLPVLVGVLIYFALAIDIIFTAIQMVTGERPTILFGSKIPRMIQTPGGFWVEGEGGPTPVELITCPDIVAEPGQIAEVSDRIIDGRYYLCEWPGDEGRPMTIGGPGPHVVRHRRYGVCVLNPPPLGVSS